MKELIIKIVSNIGAFGLLAFPAYHFREGQGLVELFVSAAFVATIFVGAYLLLYKSLKRMDENAQMLMLGKMSMHLVGMFVGFIALPYITGLDIVYLMPWLIILFFINLAIEVICLLRISKQLTEKVENS